MDLNWHEEAHRLSKLMPLAVLAEHWQISLTDVRKWMEDRPGAKTPDPVTWETGQEAYGPIFAAWLKRECPDITQDKDGALYRALNSWKNDAHRPQLDTVDKYLAPRGLHPSQVPDYCWLPHKRACGHPRRFIPEQVRAIRERVGRGETKRAIARDFGVGETTIWGISARRTYAWVS